MIRRPTPLAALLDWHRRAVAGLNPPIHGDVPECGWYKRRLVKGGPWVPVRIWIERDIDPETGELTNPERLVCDENGTPRDPMSVWTHLTPISREDYEAMLFRPAIPFGTDPKQPIDLTRSPIKWTI